MLLARTPSSLPSPKWISQRWRDSPSSLDGEGKLMPRWCVDWLLLRRCRRWAEMEQPPRMQRSHSILGSLRRPSGVTGDRGGIGDERWTSSPSFDWAVAIAAASVVLTLQYAAGCRWCLLRLGCAQRQRTRPVLVCHCRWYLALPQSRPILPAAICRRRSVGGSMSQLQRRLAAGAWQPALADDNGRMALVAPKSRPRVRPTTWQFELTLLSSLPKTSAVTYVS